MNTSSELVTVSRNPVSRDWLTRFIRKHYLAGIFDEVRWTCENGVWKVSEKNQDYKGPTHKKLMIVIQGKCDCHLPMEIVPNTKRLLRCLSIFDDEISINVLDPADYGLEYVMCPQMEVTDERNTLTLILDSKENLPPKPRAMRTVEWDFGDTFRTMDVLTYLEDYGRSRYRSKREDCSNQHLFNFKPVNWFDFNGYHLRNILQSNTDVDVVKMEASKEGLCHLSFKGDDIQSQYYLVQYACVDTGDGFKKPAS